MIGEPYGSAPERDKRRRRRRLLILFLLLFPFALGGLSGGMFVELFHSSPNASPQGTPPAPTSTPASSPSAESVLGVEVAASPTAVGSVLGSGGDTAQVGGLIFQIGGAVGSLRPAVQTPIRLTLTNPNGMPIYVTSLTVGIAPDSTPPGCGSSSNVEVAQSNVSGADPITIPARGTVTLTSAPRAPTITLLDLPNVNQDVCKNKTFALTYSGTAHS